MVIDKVKKLNLSTVVKEDFLLFGIGLCFVELGHFRIIQLFLIKQR